MRLICLSMITRYKSCFGITVWKWNKFKIELWYAPANFSVEGHTHANSDGEFFVIYGFNRKIWKIKNGQELSYNISDRPYWNRLTVRHNEQHGFNRGSTPMIWLCFETWLNNVEPSSVAKDMQFNSQ